MALWFSGASAFFPLWLLAPPGSGAQLVFGGLLLFSLIGTVLRIVANVCEALDEERSEAGR